MRKRRRDDEELYDVNTKTYRVISISAYVMHSCLHQYDHALKQDIPCPHPSCTKTFTNYMGLKVHVRSIHDQQERFLRYQCTVNRTPMPERDSTDNDGFFGAGGGTPPQQASRTGSRAGSPSDEHHHAHEDKHVHGVINGAFIHLLFVTQDLTILPRSPL